MWSENHESGKRKTRKKKAKPFLEFIQGWEMFTFLSTRVERLQIHRALDIVFCFLKGAKLALNQRLLWTPPNKA